MSLLRFFCSVISTVLMVYFSVAVYAADTGASNSSVKAADSKPENGVFTIKGQKLTVEQAIRLILERNHDLLDVRIDATTSDSSFQKFQSKYDIVVGVDSGVQYQKYPEAKWSKYGKEVTTYDVSATILKALSSGTTLSAGMTQSYNDGIDSKSNSAISYEPVMFAQIKQELLKNSFGLSERAQEKVLDSAARMQKNTVQRQISSLVAGALVDIWNVSLKRVARDNASVSLRETKRVRDVTAGNARLGISENYDLNFYNAVYASAESLYANADQGYRDAVRTLFRTFNYEITGDLPDLGDVSVLKDTFNEIDIESSIKTAYAKRVDYNNAKIALESARTELGIYKNDALPSAAVTGIVSSTASEDSVAKSNSKMTAMDTPTLGVRLSVTYPLGDSTQKTNERDAKGRLKQAELRLDKIRLEVKDDIIGRAEMVKVAFLSYQKSRTARIESERYYHSIFANLRMGKISLAVVKNALDSFNDSRQKEVEALVQYNVALMQFDLAMNLLLEKYNVDVNSYISKAE